MSQIEVDKVIPQSGTSLQLGENGDTISVPAGATFDASSGTFTLPDGSVVEAKIASNAVTTAKINNSAVTNDKLAGSIANAKLANSAITINGSSVSLGGSATIETGTSWQSSVKTSTFTAVSGEGYFINTSGGAFEADLPGSPNVTGAGYYQHLLEMRTDDEGFDRYAPSKVVDEIYGVKILNTPEYKNYLFKSELNYKKKFQEAVTSQTQYVFAKNFVEALDRLTINDPAGKDQNLAKEKSNAQRKKLFKKAAESAIGKNKSLLKPRVGLGAARSINSRIGQTAISRSKLRGRNQEVYDRYFVAKNKNGKIVAELHINNRTPDSMKSYNLSKLEIDNLIKDRPGDSVFELKDGKEKLLWKNKGNKLLKLERKGKL
jgi:hypothetical protein